MFLSRINVILIITCHFFGTFLSASSRKRPRRVNNVDIENASHDTAELHNSFPKRSKTDVLSTVLCAVDAGKHYHLPSLLKSSNFDVYEKMDGSLGILYWIDDKPFLATRGAFESEQAIKGTELLRKHQNLNKLNRNYTYLFEIIYPSNRIVVDYGAEE